MTDNTLVMIAAIGVGGLLGTALMADRHASKPDSQLVELVCFDGQRAEVKLSGVDVDLSAVSFGNGVLWSVPMESGAPQVFWQDKFSNCRIQRVSTPN